MNEIAPQEPFDYDSLDETSRRIVMQKTDETHGLMRRTAENILAIGQNLQLVQQHLPEMRFSAWLRAEFALSRQTAYNYMRVATKFSGSCQTVLQLPARILYALTSSSDTVIEQVETGQIPPTLEAIQAAKEAERQAREAEQQAREESCSRLTTIEQLTSDLEGLRRQLTAPASPTVEIKEVEKLVVPPEMTAQLDTLKQNVTILTHQRETLSQQVAHLQEQIRVEASEHPEREQEQRVRLNWYRITSEFQRSLRSILSQWPSSLDVLAFEADDWSRLSHVKELASRLLEECTRLTQATERIVEGSSEEDIPREQR
jgi:hypothetical protein